MTEGALRWLATVALALPLPLPALAESDRTAQAEGQPSCEAQALRGDRREVRCTLRATSARQRFRFLASFAGSHDDTTLSMTPTLDGAPLVCGPGSRTRLEGEDGDVTLECSFTLADTGRAEQALSVLLVWYHARYTGFELVPE